MGLASAGLAAGGSFCISRTELSEVSRRPLSAVQHQNVSSFTPTLINVLCAPYREASYEIEESKAVRDGLCETRAALKQTTENLHAVQQSQEQLEAEVQQEQLRTVWELSLHANQRFSGYIGITPEVSLLQESEKHKAQRLAKQLEDKNVQINKLR